MIYFFLIDKNSSFRRKLTYQVTGRNILKIHEMSKVHFFAFIAAYTQAV